MSEQKLILEKTARQLEILKSYYWTNEQCLMLLNEMKEALIISGVSVRCIDFAIWMQDNYSPTLKDKRPLPKGNMRLDFTDEIYTVEEIYEKYNAR